MRTILQTTVAAIAALGFANAATVITPPPLFQGQDFQFAGMIGTNNADDDQFKFDITPGMPNTQFDISFSATDLASELEVILVGRGDTGDDFSVAMSPLEIIEGGIADAGTFRFDSFTTSDAFSIFINGEDLSGDTPFTLSVFAEAGGPDVAPIPVPGAGLLLLTAVGGFAAARRNRS